MARETERERHQEEMGQLRVQLEQEMKTEELEQIQKVCRDNQTLLHCN